MNSTAFLRATFSKAVYVPNRSLIERSSQVGSFEIKELRFLIFFFFLSKRNLELSIHVFLVIDCVKLEVRSDSQNFLILVSHFVHDSSCDCFLGSLMSCVNFSNCSIIDKL